MGLAFGRVLVAEFSNPALRLSRSAMEIVAVAAEGARTASRTEYRLTLLSSRLGRRQEAIAAASGRSNVRLRGLELTALDPV
jgi:hypothetical protein